MWGCTIITLTLYFRTPSIIAFALGEQAPHWYSGKNLKIHLNHFDILPISLDKYKSVYLSSNLTFLRLNMATTTRSTLEGMAKNTWGQL
jgi:hypothetical protein